MNKVTNQSLKLAELIPAAIEIKEKRAEDARRQLIEMNLQDIQGLTLETLDRLLSDVTWGPAAYRGKYYSLDYYIERLTLYVLHTDQGEAQAPARKP